MVLRAGLGLMVLGSAVMAVAGAVGMLGHCWPPHFGLLMLALWFAWGWWTRLGFRDGLLLGAIGASPAVVMMLASLVQQISSRGENGYNVMLPWAAPFLGLLRRVGVVEPRQTLYVLYALVGSVILLCGLGSWAADLRACSRLSEGE